MRKNLILTLLLFTTNVWGAGPVITSISGVSSYNLTGTPTIFGGLGGTACTDAGAANIATCNSCQTSVTPACGTAGANTPLCACNEARVYDGLHVRITVQDTTPTGNVRIQLVPPAGGTAGTVVARSAGNNFAEIWWSDICGAGGMGNTDCESVTDDGANNSATLRVFYDKNNNGIIDTGGTGSGTSGTSEETTDVSVRAFNPRSTSYNEYNAPTVQGVGAFEPYPGDEKIYVEKVDTPGGFPLMTYGGLATNVRVYFSDVNLPGASPYDPAAFKEDLPIIENGATLDKNIINNLENGKLYFFRVAVLDQASNVVQYFPSHTDADASLAACTSTPGTAACKYAATPDQVLGLLSKDVNCFIASAAYGSSLEPKLKTFRDFRYHILLRHVWGQKFVKAYYNYGPIAARYIYDKPILRAITRGFLWPLYGFSWIALQFGLLNSVLLSLILITSVLLLPWIGVRRISARA